MNDVVQMFILWKLQGTDINTSRFFVSQFSITKQVTTTFFILAADPAGFDSCNASPSLGVYDSGNDALTLSVAGTYYFLCGYHCDNLQQKFFITVN